MAADRFIGIWRNLGEINDRPGGEISRTEFGLPPSNYEGRFGNGAPFAFFAKHAQKRSSRNHLIHSVPPATLPHFVQPVLELKQPPEGIRAKAATPSGYLPRRRFAMCTHPPRHLNIVGAGGNKVTQRRRLETGGNEKLAIHRTIVMIRARPPE
jgi:hypothetical protein